MRHVAGGGVKALLFCLCEISCVNPNTRTHLTQPPKRATASASLGFSGKKLTKKQKLCNQARAREKSVNENEKENEHEMSMRMRMKTLLNYVPKARWMCV